MLVEIILDDIVGNVTAGRAKVVSCPEPPVPISLAQFWEFLLDFSRGTALHTLHKLAYRNMRRNFHKHVDMVARQNAVDDVHAQFSTNLTHNRPQPFPDTSTQYLITIFRKRNINRTYDILRDCFSFRFSSYSGEPLCQILALI